MAAAAFAVWRTAGALAAVRVNPLESDGHADLRGVLAAKPDIVMMSKVESPEQVRALEAAVPGRLSSCPISSPLAPS